MGDVAGHDDGSFKVHARGDGILGELLTHGVDALVQVDLDAFAAFSGLAQRFGNQFRGVGVHLLQPDAVAVDLSLDVAVGRARHAHADGAGGTVTGQTDDANVVGKMLAAELCTKSNLVGFEQEFLLEVDVAEGTSGLIARGGQVVVILDRSELHREQVLLGRCAADDEGNVIGRTGGRAECLHLLHKEGQQGAFVLDGGLGHGVEVGLVGRASTLGNHHETVFGAFYSLDVNLSRQVAAGVNLVVHVQRSILRVAQVVLCVGVIDTE